MSSIYFVPPAAKQAHNMTANTKQFCFIFSKP